MIPVRRHVRRRQSAYEKHQIRRYGHVPTRMHNAKRALDEAEFETRMQPQAGLGWVIKVTPRNGRAFFESSKEVRAIADKHHLRVGFDYFTMGYEKAYLEMPSEEYTKSRGWGD